jgi:hypothetical protein
VVTTHTIIQNPNPHGKGNQKSFNQTARILKPRKNCRRDEIQATKRFQNRIQSLFGRFYALFYGEKLCFIQLGYGNKPISRQNRDETIFARKILGTTLKRRSRGFKSRFMPEVASRSARGSSRNPKMETF